MMSKTRLLAAVATWTVVVAGLAGGAHAFEDFGRAPSWLDRVAARGAQRSPWHGDYYHTNWGRPLALVVPPTAGRQSVWSWGAARTMIAPNRHQYSRVYPGYVDGGAGQFYPTPRWPNHTDQYGVYYVRGPW